MLHTSQTPTFFPGGMPMPRDLRVLLLDDSNFDRARIRRLAKKTDFAVQLDEVDSIAEMDAAVAKENYDLILIDYRLPVGDGIVALEHVLQNDQNKDAGKIMITGDGARQTAVQAMRAGCHDFLTKEEMSVDALGEAMMNALTTAQHRQQMIQQSEHQREIIRQGLIAAMQDSEVQNNVVSMVRNQMGISADELRSKFEATDVDALLAGFGDEDTFVFH